MERITRLHGGAEVTLEQLTTLREVHDQGSFTRAAQRMHMTQPALSRRLKALAEEIGDPLLLGEGADRRLTPAGELLYAMAGRLDFEFQQLFASLEALRRPGAGRLAIGCVAALTLFTLPQILTAYQRTHPHVRLAIRTGEIQDTVARLLHAQVDVGLVTVPIHHPRIQSVPLFHDPVVLVGSPERTGELCMPLELSALAELEVITYSAPSRFRTFVDGVLEQHGVHLNVSMEFDSHEAVRVMALGGFGLALLPFSTAAADLEHGTLKQVAVRGLPPMQRTTSLLLSRNRPTTEAVAGFVETVGKVLKPRRRQLRDRTRRLPAP